MKAFRVILLLVALFMMVYCQERRRGGGSRPASTCFGNCMLLRKCDYLLKKLRYGIPNVRHEIRSLTCGRQGIRIKVCCPKWDEVENSFFPKNCGYNPKFAKKIVAGNETEMGEFPWAAALEYEKDGNKRFMCSGAIINSRYVLTAAHCLDEKRLQRANATFISVRLGDWDLSQEKDCIRTNTAEMQKCAPPYIEAKPEKISIHPMFNKRLSGDIALIRLDKTIDFEKSKGYIQPICLPSYGVNARLLAMSRDPTVIGWGTTDTEKNSPILRKARVPVLDKNICVRHYSTLFGSRQLCVGGTKADSCQGDSGGPLFLEGPRGPPYLQIGITSFGTGICGSKIPAVYTSVTNYMTWIRTNMEPWQI